MMDVPVENVFETLQVYLGSSYVNDFTLFGRNYRVTAQADAPYRLAPGGRRPPAHPQRQRRDGATRLARDAAHVIGP